MTLFDGKQIRDNTVTPLKLTFSAVEDGNLAWREPVAVLQLIGNASIATINGLSPSAGDAYVATDAGTPSAGTSDALVAGSIAEFDGTSWKEIVAGSGGFVPSGTRAALATQTALIAPYTDTTDDGKVVSFSGASNTGSATGEAVDGYAVLVNGDGGVNENLGYVFSGSVPTGTWVAFGGGVLTAGDGIDIAANVVSTDLLASGGLKIVSTELAVEPADFAGTGLEDDGSDNLRLATQGNGISGGAGSTLSVNADSTTGGNIQPVNVVANGVGLDVSAIAGTGLEADGSANLRLAAQGNGIAGGAGSTLSVDSDTETGGNIQGVNVTANGVGVDISAIAGTGLAADGSANLAIDEATGSVTFTGGTWTFPVDVLQVTGSPNSANDAVNKNYVDNVAAGLSWKDPVTAKDYLGTRTIAQIDALSPTSGQTVVAGDAGTPSAGTSDALVAGSVAEFDGTSWKQLVAGSGGFVPDGTRLIVHDETVTLFSPLADGTDESKLAVFDGTTNTPTLTTAADGDASLVSGNGSVNENTAFTYDSGTAAWVQFTGGGSLTAGDGIDIAANVVSVDLLASGGLKIVSTELGVEPADFAGTGLEDDGSDNLRIATQGNGLTGGGGTTLSVLAANDSVGVTGSGVEASVPSASNKNMTASTTSSDGDSATATTVVAASANGSWYGLTVNGILVNLTEDKLGDAYISGDSGTTAKTFATVAASDTIHWNGSIAGYELATTDRLSLLYEAAV